jgi:hypothetical protein
MYIDGMIVQTDNSRPHVVSVMKTLAKQFPYIIWKIGGYNDRQTADGGESFHALGRACDVYLEAGCAVDLQLGNLLFQMFHQNAADLKIDHVIWNSHIWSTDKGGPRLFTKGNGGAHTNHIHVAFRKDDKLDNPSVHIEQLCGQVRDRLIAGGGDAPDYMDGL